MKKFDESKYVALRQRYYGWLDTPPEDREPKSEYKLARQLNVIPATLVRWRGRRAEYDVLPVREIVNKLGDRIDLNLQEIENLIKTGTKEQKLEKAKDVILYIGLKERKFPALVEYLKSEGAYIIKTEEKHSYELTAEDKAEIIRLIGEIQRDFSKGDSGTPILSAKPPLLSG